MRQNTQSFVVRTINWSLYGPLANSGRLFFFLFFLYFENRRNKTNNVEIFILEKDKFKKKDVKKYNCLRSVR